MAEEKEFTICRLPPYQREVNPIELVWTDVKQHVASHDKTFRINIMEGVMIDALNSVTEQQWRNYCRHVEDTEKRM